MGGEPNGRHSRQAATSQAALHAGAAAGESPRRSEAIARFRDANVVCEVGACMKLVFKDCLAG